MFLFDKSRNRVHPTDDSVVGESIVLPVTKLQWQDFDTFTLAKNVFHAIRTYEPNWLDYQQLKAIEVRFLLYMMVY